LQILILQRAGKTGSVDFSKAAKRGMFQTYYMYIYENHRGKKLQHK
jgi:hypothetical protein